MVDVPGGQAEWFKVIMVFRLSLRVCG